MGPRLWAKNTMASIADEKVPIQIPNMYIETRNKKTTPVRSFGRRDPGNEKRETGKRPNKPAKPDATSDTADKIG
jgi:hypothetical protein